MVKVPRDSARVRPIFSAAHTARAVLAESLVRARKQAHALEPKPLDSALVLPMFNAALILPEAVVAAAVVLQLSIRRRLL